MSISNSKEWLKIEEILQGVNYCIAGGYARDTYFGFKPKDMDVGVFGLDATEILDIVSLLEMYNYIVESHIDEDELMQAHYEGNHIAGIITCKGDIDLIFCNELIETPHEWTKTFDYNLNQFIMIDGKPKFNGEQYETLRFYNHNTNRVNKAVARKDKMIKLADKIGWIVTESLRDLDVKLSIQQYQLKQQLMN